MRRIPLQLRAEATITETENTEAIDVSAYEGVILKIVASEESGTTTLDIVVQDSEDGTTWHTLETVSQITANGTVMVRKTRFLKYIRLAITLGGTSYTLVVTGWGLRIE